MTPSRIMASLNALTFGDIEAVRVKLEAAAGACRELGYEDLAVLLVEARDGLSGGDLKLYRKRVETVVSRLGHKR